MNVRDQRLDAAVLVDADAGCRGAADRRCAATWAPTTLIPEAIARGRRANATAPPDRLVNPFRERCDWIRSHPADLREHRAPLRAVSPRLMGVRFADAKDRNIMRDMFPTDSEEALRRCLRRYLRGLGIRFTDSPEPAT